MFNTTLFGGIAVAAIVAITLFVMVLLRRVVPTNVVHIVQSRKKTTPYGRQRDAGNVYYEIPSWVPVFGISVIKLPESIFEVHLTNYGGYDTKRVPFKVTVVAFFRIAKPEEAAQKVASFDELKHQLESVLQGSIRRVLATNDLEHILEARGTLGEAFTAEVKANIEQWGVESVKMVEFMDIQDAEGSSAIQDIMAKEKSRIDMESRIAVSENERLAREREIENTRQVAVAEQDAKQQIGIRTAEQEQKVGIAKEQAQQEVQREAKTTAERAMEVKSVKDNRTAEIDAQVSIKTAEGHRDSTIRRAEGDAKAVEVKSAADLVQAENAAKGALANGQAAAESAKLLGLAGTAPQIELAKEIGGNEGYQTYLVKIEQVRVGGEVGKATADAIKAAKIQIISTGGQGIVDGVGSVGDLFTPAGGTKLSGMLAGLAQTDAGKAVLSALGVEGSSTGGDPNPEAGATIQRHKANGQAGRH